MSTWKWIKEHILISIDDFCKMINKEHKSKKVVIVSKKSPVANTYLITLIVQVIVI